MGRFGCLLSLVLMGFAFVALFALVVLPVIPGFRDNPLLMQFQAAINCPSGYTFENEFDTYRPRPGGTIEAATGYCVAPDGERTMLNGDQQTRMFLIYTGIFVVPFIIGLFMAIGSLTRATRGGIVNTLPAAGVTSTQHTFDLRSGDTDAIRQMTGIDVRRTDGGVSIVMPGMSEPMVLSKAAGTASDQDLASRLQQIEEAHKKGLISKEEYESLRKAILDDMV